MNALENAVAVENAAKDFAEELRGDTVAIRLEISKYGQTRTMSSRHRHEVAEHFNASDRAVSGTKKLFASKPQALKNITTAIGRIEDTWKGCTLFYPAEKGVRLIRREDLNWFIRQYDSLKAELDEAVTAADSEYESILAASKADLGDELFNRADYPASFKQCVDAQWRTFNFEPSEDLLKLAPQTYQREQARVKLLFDQVVIEYENEVKQQLVDLIDALLLKLQPEDGAAGDDAKKVVWREAAATNLREFFERFEKLGVFSNDSLNDVVNSAKSALGATKMSDLKVNPRKAAEVVTQFSEIKTALAAVVLVEPTRKIDLSDLE